MTIVFAILLFSLLIFVHELGHFVAAKASGVRVNEFSMFMGPAIFKKQVGETLYALRCIPFGGYCAMEGEDQETDDPRSFQKAAWWKRLIILVAGSFMNFVAGLLIFAIVFAPANESIYFPDASTFVNEHACSQGLCGRSRPIHFRGVCTVVNLLFNLAQPNVAVFGQKDAQQVAVLKRMVRDLHIPVEMLVGPIVREADGLALSSRNQYLTARERAAAPQIHAELQTLADLAKTESNASVLAKHFMDALGQDAVFEPEYIEIVNNSTMLPADKIETGNTLVAVAVRMTESRTRLIDNIVL